MFLVKRAIGIPGDRIHLKNGIVYLNGVAQDEPEAAKPVDDGNFQHSYDPYRDDFPAIPPTGEGVTALWADELPSHIVNGDLVVPPGKVFAMGDNRTESLDGRYWGFVPRENIVGRPPLRLLVLRDPSRSDRQAEHRRPPLLYGSHRHPHLRPDPLEAHPPPHQVTRPTLKSRPNPAKSAGFVLSCMDRNDALFRPTRREADRPSRALLPPVSWIALIVSIVLLLLLFLPPYINVNRYQRRITQSISASLGRPVHLDHVTLNLLPIPGFTLERFVVSEDPAFGYEPTIRADTVHASLRVSSLWRRHVEFSTISLTDPSINLVHTSNGKWNLDSILLQASHIDTAPTAQRTAGPAPRFPYIEATGARLNLKLDNVKTPFSLTDADFSLYLPSPQTWNVRITAHPARTDLPVGYTGILHLDGTLGRAPTLDQIPIDLHAEWKSAPLGEISRIVLGRDAGLRGDMTLTASALGTVGSNELHTRVRIDDIHRPDFVPANALSVTTECTATVTSAFHSIASAHCAIPSGSSSAPPLLSFSGSLEDIRRPGPASISAELPPTPASQASSASSRPSAPALPNASPLAES